MSPDSRACLRVFVAMSTFFRSAAVAMLLATTTPAWPEPPAPSAWNVDTIPWQTKAPNGTKYALLEGSRDKPGKPFTYAFFIPAGVWDSPHWHSTTARVFVAKGALGLGFGDRLDTTKASQYPAGSYVVVPGLAHHFDGAAVETIIIGVATGPWSTTYLDGSKPASAGTPAPKAPAEAYTSRSAQDRTRSSNCRARQTFQVHRHHAPVSEGFRRTNRSV